MRMNPVRRVEQFALVVSMFVGSIGMWLGSPVLWIWLAGRTSKISTTAMGSLLMILIGIPVTMVLIGKILARLDARYTASFGTTVSGARSPARWLHSMRGGNIVEQPTMLDKVMVLSVSIALLAVGTWYIGFSGGSAARHS
jgi:hypothetical protein